MPTYKDGSRADLAALMESLLATKRENLVREDLGNVGFQSVAEDIDRIRRIVFRLNACDLDLVPATQIGNCTQFVRDVQLAFDRMVKFEPLRSNMGPAAERDQIAQQCRNVFASSVDRVALALAMAVPTVQETGEEARLILESAKSGASTVLTEVQAETDRAKKEIESNLESVRKATGAVGIEKQAEVFKNAAGEHATARKRWLNTTILLAVVTAIALLLNWGAAYKLGPPSTKLGLVQLSIAKVLVFTFLLSAVVWSGKIYRSHQHNYVLNKHRQNALETFQLFARGAEDAETKSMVLLQATRCIFSPQPTGFLSGDRETDGDGPQILEIIRNLSSTNK